MKPMHFKHYVVDWLQFGFGHRMLNLVESSSATVEAVLCCQQPELLLSYWLMYARANDDAG